MNAAFSMGGRWPRILAKVLGVFVLALITGVISGLCAALMYIAANDGHYEREPALLFILVGTVSSIAALPVLGYFFFFKRRRSRGVAASPATNCAPPRR
jgi:ABC-type amino acid transport system permease subunit